MASPVGRAVVVGGGVSGLLAAAALTEHAEEVVVLDRDLLPHGSGLGAGNPTDGPEAGLPSWAAAVVEDLVPGVVDTLVRAGAEAYVDGGRGQASGPGFLAASGLAVAVSQRLLGRVLRQRLERDPTVRFRGRTSVLFPAERRGRVEGVVVTDRARPGYRAEIRADLVVDASGRCSRAPVWMCSRDHAAPVEERLRLDAVFATRGFRRRPGDVPGVHRWLLASPDGGRRAALLSATEDDLWQVSLVGYHGERPPPSLDCFLDYAAGIPGPLGPALRRMPALGEAAHRRFATAVRRRYEQDPGPPRGLVVLGGAATSLDPVLGWQAGLAARDALVLRSCLADGVDHPGREVALRSAPHRDLAWEAARASAPRP